MRGGATNLFVKVSVIHRIQAITQIPLLNSASLQLLRYTDLLFVVAIGKGTFGLVQSHVVKA
jgi:hypothetical protein